VPIQVRYELLDAAVWREIGSEEAQPAAAFLANSSDWDPFKFIDLVESVSRDPVAKFGELVENRLAGCIPGSTISCPRTNTTNTSTIIKHQCGDRPRRAGLHLDA